MKPSAGDRVVWRSAVQGNWTEKMGMVVYSGPPSSSVQDLDKDLGLWFTEKMRDEVMNRDPGSSLFSEYKRTRTYTSGGRYLFDRCSNGVVVAVYETITIPHGKVRARTKKPWFYAPRLEATKQNTVLKVWEEGQDRPQFPEQEISTLKGGCCEFPRLKLGPVRQRRKRLSVVVYCESCHMCWEAWNVQQKGRYSVGRLDLG